MSWTIQSQAENEKCFYKNDFFLYKLEIFYKSQKTIHTSRLLGKIIELIKFYHFLYLSLGENKSSSIYLLTKWVAKW